MDKSWVKIPSQSRGQSLPLWTLNVNSGWPVCKVGWGGGICISGKQFPVFFFFDFFFNLPDTFTNFTQNLKRCPKFFRFLTCRAIKENCYKTTKYGKILAAAGLLQQNLAANQSYAPQATREWIGGRKEPNTSLTAFSLNARETNWKKNILHFLWPEWCSCVTHSNQNPNFTELVLHKCWVLKISI